MASFCSLTSCKVRGSGAPLPSFCLDPSMLSARVTAKRMSLVCSVNVQARRKEEVEGGWLWQTSQGAHNNELLAASWHMSLEFLNFYCAVDAARVLHACT